VFALFQAILIAGRRAAGWLDSHFGPKQFWWTLGLLLAVLVCGAAAAYWLESYAW
jgi:hypothetical protein